MFSGKHVPVTILFIVAMFQLVAHFTTALRPAAAELVRWGVILAAFAFWVALINLILYNFRKVQRRSRDWGHGVALLCALALFLVVGFGFGSNSALYRRLFESTVSTFGQAYWGVVLFFILSAAFRGFRARNWQAVIILASSLIFMLGQVPIGDVMIPGISRVGQWLQNVPNNAGQRGIILGAAVGAIAQQLRVMVGLERGHFGG